MTPYEGRHPLKVRPMRRVGRRKVKIAEESKVPEAVVEEDDDSDS